MTHNWKYMIGLPPLNPEPKTVDDMRKAILYGSRDSSLIYHCISSSDARGASGEDKYAMLAYYALVELQRAHDLLNKFANCTVQPLVIQKVNP